MHTTSAVSIFLTCLYVNSFINIVTACNRQTSGGGKCCPELGEFCFSQSGLFSVDPKCPSSFSPNFTLFIRDGPSSGMPITRDNIPSDFTNDRKTVYIVHGWRGSFYYKYQRLKDALLEKEDLNVIAVDWRHGASAITYVPAASNTQSIGAMIGALTNVLRTQNGSNPDFWCIGHSLGAHACGYSSLTAQPWLERITGVDPAGPEFDEDKGLTQNSAVNVDIIHTDPLFGSRHPRGHVEFYPNGGRNQPGCAGSMSAMDEKDPDELSRTEKVEAMVNIATENAQIGCSHQRSLLYMINSVKYPSCYVAKQVCHDYKDIPGSCTDIPPEEQRGVMGYDAINHRYTGYLYFEPSLYSPHCVD